MTDGKKEEEIIELTEVIEEKPGKTAAGPLKEPKGEERRELKVLYGFPSVPGAPPVPEPPWPLIPDYASELKAMKEALEAKAEKWMATEGVQVLERAAREIFPKIAEEVLRKEIEKIKAKVEEKA